MLYGIDLIMFLLLLLCVAFNIIQLLTVKLMFLATVFCVTFQSRRSLAHDLSWLKIKDVKRKFYS